MQTFTPFSSLFGGALIGLAASILLLCHGRVAGVAGILGETLRGDGARGEAAYRLAFLVGLGLAGLALRVVQPAALVGSPSSWPVVAFAGVLVGYGTRLGGGCTSGHGVCGLSRLSGRSLVATLTFIAVAGATVFVSQHLLGSAR